MQPLMSSKPAILIVEDEPLIAMMVEDFLDILGYRTIGPADSVEGALDLVRAGGFDAAILDVNLRGGEVAWPVADALAEAGMPFMLATGGQSEAHPAHHAGVSVLDKPFTLDGLKSAFEKLLDR